LQLAGTPTGVTHENTPLLRSPPSFKTLLKNGLRRSKMNARHNHSGCCWRASDVNQNAHVAALNRSTDEHALVANRRFVKPRERFA
jgi:hypothetical protein